MGPEEDDPPVNETAVVDWWRASNLALLCELKHPQIVAVLGGCLLAALPLRSAQPVRSRLPVRPRSLSEPFLVQEQRLT